MRTGPVRVEASNGAGKVSRDEVEGHLARPVRGFDSNGARSHKLRLSSSQAHTDI